MLRHSGCFIPAILSLVTFCAPAYSAKQRQIDNCRAKELAHLAYVTVASGRISVRSIVRIIIGTPLLVFSLFAASVWAATTEQVDNARIKGLAFLYKYQNGDGSWGASPGPAVQSTHAALGAFFNAGIRKGLSYSAAMAWISAATPPSIDGQARRLSALTASSAETTKTVQQLVNARN